MFSVEATPVMFAGLLVMFGWCCVWSLVEVLRVRALEHRVSQVLHLLMSVVMVLMVARTTWTPLRDAVGIPALIALFSLSAAWFVALAIRSRGHAGLVGDHTGALGAPTPDAAWWVALVGLPVMGYLLAAGSVALVRTMAPIRAEPTPAAGCHEPRPTGPLTQRSTSSASPRWIWACSG